MTQNNLKTGMLFREVQISDVAEDRTVSVAFSSEEPVERFFGTEVLDHDARSIRLGRLREMGPLLVNHDPNDLVGKVEDVTVGQDRVARAQVRFGKSDRAEEVFQDVKDGIRSGISVGYHIHTLEEQDDKGDEKLFRATDWEPMEISLVTIPADASVGVGRSVDDSFITRIKPLIEEVKPMTDKVEVVNEPAPSVDVEQIKKEARRGEVSRVQDLIALGDKFNKGDLAHQYIDGGRSVEEMRKAILDDYETPSPAVQSAPDNLDMEPKERRSYSMFRAINASASGDWSNAGLEREASKEIAKRLGKEPRGFYAPSDIEWGKRDMTVGSATAGGNLKGTDLLASDFVDALRPKLVLADLGAKMMTGLVGDVAIPALNAKTSTYWVAESGVPIEGAPTVRQISMAPSTVGAYVDISRKLSKQGTPDAENIFRNDMVQQVASAIDTVGINGGGSNEPTGILQTSGIGATNMGDNGLAPTWESVVNNVREVSIDNALGGNLAFLTNPKVVAKMRNVVRVSSTDSRFIMDDRNDLFGYRVVQTNNVPSNLTKGTSSGVCSAFIFGNFADLIIGQWGGTDILVDPYTGSGSGTIRVVVFADVDIAVRHAQSFSATQDYLTT